MVHDRPNLLHVILQMDPKDIAAIAGIHLVPVGGLYQASFTLVSSLAGRTKFVQHPGAAVPVSSREPVTDQVRAVQDSGRLGTLSTTRIRPPGAHAGSPEEYIVKTHAGSEAERAAWLRALRQQ